LYTKDIIPSTGSPCLSNLAPRHDVKKVAALLGLDMVVKEKISLLPEIESW
jgi:hypothetical protein